MAETPDRSRERWAVSAVIPLAEPVLAGNESRYVQRCMDSGYVSSVGEFVNEFEQVFAAGIGSANAVACSSGTAALHVALRLAGASPGSLVAVSDFTFIASANAISYTGADLLLVDSEPETWNMDTERLRDEVVSRAAAGRRLPDIIEAVHILGHPVDLEPLLELRDRYGTRIVEDAAESLGGSWCAGKLAGKLVGTVGDLGCFSFNGNKIITTGGGGMITTDDRELAVRAKHLTNQAKLPGADYVHDVVGYNYRLNNVQAAIGLAQLESLPAALEAKRRIAARYTEALADSPVTLAPRAKWAEPTFWLYSVLLDETAPIPERVVPRLHERGVGARRLWSPLHAQAPYRTTECIGGEVAERIYRRGLSMPSSVNLTDQDQELAIAALKDLLTP